MTRSRAVLLSLLLPVALIAASCGGDDGDGDGGDSALPVKEQGVLTVGSNVAFAPFEYLEAGEPVGFDIDLAQEIADRMGLELEIVDNPSFDALIPALQDGQYDIVIAAVTILPEREEVIDFSEPYIEADQGLVINLEQTPDVASSADLTSDMILGAQRNTTSSAYAEENFADQVAEIRLFDQTPEALADLAVGRIQVVVADFPAAAFATQTEYEDQLAVVDRLTTGEQYGIAVSQDKPEILEEVNRILAEMQADGTYDEIFAKWFGEAP